MAASSYKRLKKELEQLTDSQDEYIQLDVAGEDWLKWICTIRGPPSSPFEDYVFHLSVDVSERYPIEPPRIRFLTKIFHPNVDFNSGEICLDVLKSTWSPAWSLQSACRAIQSIMSEPNADSPLNVDAGNMVRHKDFAAFYSTVQMYCKEYSYKIPTDLLVTNSS